MSSSAPLSFQPDLLCSNVEQIVYVIHKTNLHFLSIYFVEGKTRRPAGSVSIKEELAGVTPTDLEAGMGSGERISGQPIDQFKIFVLSYTPVEGFHESICNLDLQFSRFGIFDHFQHAASQIIVIATTEKLND